MTSAYHRAAIAAVLVLNVAAAIGAHVIWETFSRPVGAAAKPKTIAAPPPAPTEEERVIGVITKASPAVVSILVQQPEPKTATIIFDDRGVRQEESGGGFKEVGRGTGYLVRADGLIVTNRHVAFSRNAKYTVFLEDERSFDARVIDIDPVNDLAILKIEASGLPFLQLEPKDDPRIGQTVIVIGNALGKYANTVTRGILSGINRSLEAANERTGETEHLEDVLQTDAAINSGNSGGPLLNLNGRVIGVSAAIERGGQSLGFAIPSYQVRLMLDSYARYGSIARPRIGIRYVQITPEHKTEFNLRYDEGAWIHARSEQGPAVLPGSPGERAGLRAEEFILEVNGEKVRGKRTLGRIVQSYNVGDMLRLKVGKPDGTVYHTSLQLEAHVPYQE